MGCQTRMSTPCGCVVGAELWILGLSPTMMGIDNWYNRMGRFSDSMESARNRYAPKGGTWCTVSALT